MTETTAIKILQSLLNSGNFYELIEKSTDFLKLFPKSSELNYITGVALANSDEIEEAHLHFRNAVNLSKGENAGAYACLTSSALEIGDKGLGLKLLELGILENRFDKKLEEQVMTNLYNAIDEGLVTYDELSKNIKEVADLYSPETKTIENHIDIWGEIITLIDEIGVECIINNDIIPESPYKLIRMINDKLEKEAEKHITNANLLDEFDKKKEVLKAEESKETNITSIDTIRAGKKPQIH